jgi:tRNA pseudouridine38-40 synthase
MPVARSHNLPSMFRVALGIEYDGSAYCGWQRQTHSPSVQQNVESALSFVADHDVELVCAGRTDTGVHACQQVVHFDTSSERSIRAWMLGANCRLPKDIRILWVQPVTTDFHARFTAIARSYRYIILNSEIPSALFNNKVCWQHQLLDSDKMHLAAQQLVGKFDFTSFRAAGCQAKSPVRDIKSIEISRQGDLIYLDIKANAFLHHMVRNISGSLIAIGRGEYPIEWLQEVLQARDRRQAAMTAVASGLYFLRPYYPEQFELPCSVRKPVLF